MARITLPQGEFDESIRVLGVQPAMGNAMAVMSDAIYSKSGLDLRVRELIRMRVAQINACQVCLNYRFPELEAEGINETFYSEVASWRESELFSDREKLAVEFAERFILDHLNIDDTFFDALKAHYSSTEIYEMSTTIAGLLANGRVMQVLHIDQSCAL